MNAMRGALTYKRGAPLSLWNGNPPSSRHIVSAKRQHVPTMLCGWTQLLASRTRIIAVISRLSSRLRRHPHACRGQRSAKAKSLLSASARGL